MGKTPVLAAVDGRAAVVLAVADPIKDDSAAAVAARRGSGPGTVHFCSAGCAAAHDEVPGRPAAVTAGTAPAAGVR